MTNAEHNELLQQLGQTSVCQIADARGPSLALDTQIRPLDTSFRICAPACTVLCPPDDNLTLHHALHIARGRDLERQVLGRGVRLHLLNRVLPYGRKAVIFV